MKTKIQVLLIILSISTASFAEHPNVKLAESFIDNLAKIEGGMSPSVLEPVSSGKLRIATEAEISKTEVEAIYYRSCKKLQSQYGSEVKTYRWTYRNGENNQATVVQFDFGQGKQFYLIAHILEIKDVEADTLTGVAFQFERNSGIFDPKGRQKLDNWELEDFLRKAK